MAQVSCAVAPEKCRDTGPRAKAQSLHWSPNFRELERSGAHNSGVVGVPSNSSSSAAEQLKAETLIGIGLTSEVFTWGDRVLKLFLPWTDRERAQREFMISRAVCAMGVPMPTVFDLVQVGPRHGIIFSRVRGISMLGQVEARPWKLFRAARELAELHAGLHAYTAPPELPSQREQIEGWIRDAADFTEVQKEAARQHAARLPPGDSLCHGDFHPANILLSERGPVIIDWSRATRGHPLADVARTSVLFEVASLPPTSPLHIRLLMKVARRLLHTTYLKRYLELRPGTLQEIEFWRVPQRTAASAWLAKRRAAMARAGIKSADEA